MSTFNPLERAIARTLNRFPFIKGVAKASYARLMFVKNKKNYQSQSIAKPLSFADANGSSFFGYYDKSPMNHLGFTLVCLTQADTAQEPSIKQEVDLAVFDNGGNLLFKLPVNAFNWQQGCRAHWLDDEFFIFNDFDKTSKTYISRVYSVSQQLEVKTFSYPVQDSFNKDYFISLNYRRLQALRPDYGYGNLPALTNEQLADNCNDGLWKVDYETGAALLIISISNVCAQAPKPEFEQAVHKLNHVMISPDGQRFIFMHRYFVSGQRFDRLFLSDASGQHLKLLSDYGMVSHCFWVNEHTIFGYLRGPGQVDGYWLLNTEDGSFTPFTSDNLKKFGDGHPHVHGDWFITDSYPDKARMQHLLLGNFKTGNITQVGEFFHGFEFDGQSRCDLHPRFSVDGKYVFFDSVFSGKRQFYKMDISEIINNE